MHVHFCGFDLEIVVSSRRTIAIEIKNCSVIVRAPVFMKNDDILDFVQKKRQWIDKHLAKALQNKNDINKSQPYTKDEIFVFTNKALEVIPPKVEFYSKLIGVDYAGITVRHQKTRWASCSSKGNLSFNCLLVCFPDEVIDSVIVHELCHRKYMNHSKEFYREVLHVFPNYNTCNRWLKDYGYLYLRRL